VTRLLCPECHDLRPILSGSLKEDASVLLKCGHERTTGLLPLRAGKISFENLNSAAGRNAFPIDAQELLPKAVA
jgi:hypothetical protein